jgi:taurine dioxygenase
MSITITHVGADIGSLVTGLALQDITPLEFGQLRDLVAHRGVVAVRGQALDQAEQVRFARRFGELQKIFIQEALSTQYPELFFVSNVVKDGKPLGSRDAGVFWHTDGAYLERPHNVSMLYAEEVPRENGRALGDTLFAGMGAAYDALPGDMRARLDGLRAVHSLHHRYGTKGGNADDMAQRAQAFPPVSHPLVIRHPQTGRKCLYLSEGYTTHIEGLPATESEQLLAQLCEHVVDPAFRYRHSWEEGDLLIWDNGSTLHRATFDYTLPQRRVMRRATVAGQALG